jgi:hypothetical protein
LGSLSSELPRTKKGVIDKLDATADELCPLAAG